MSLKIGIIIGSTRPGRSGADVAKWYFEQVKSIEDAEFDLIDIADYNLPLLDEAYPPSMGNYQNKHTTKWAEVIEKYDGYVWVTPEYNHSAPASLTNAISYLFAEWVKKPVAFVSYGSMGGVRAVEHLRGIAGELQMADIRLQVAIRNPWAMKDDKGDIKADLVYGNPSNQAEELIWWANALKVARTETALISA